MRIRTAFCLAALLMYVGHARADMVIVDEDFESYADEDALYQVWQPRNGAGDSAPAAPDDGLIANAAFNETAYPGDGLGGAQGVDHIGNSVMQYVPALGSEGSGAAIVPTATQSIVLTGDIFDTGASGNKRMSIGLRNRTNTGNILELGLYNSFLTPEEEPLPNPTYGYRMVLYPGLSTGTFGGWVPITLDPTLDTGEEPDGIVGPGDIGEAWHRYSATITPSDITVTLDLYRDGLNNATGEPGVDFTETMAAVTTDAGYDSLRIGAPSGISSAGGGVLFDNISLVLVDVEPPMLTGDYNGDSVVDAADYTVWRDTLTQTVTPGEGADGNNNGMIDNDDYTVWADNYGASSSVPAAASAAPEPAGAVLACLLTGCGALVRRRRA